MAQAVRHSLGPGAAGPPRVLLRWLRRITGRSGSKAGLLSAKR